MSYTRYSLYVIKIYFCFLFPLSVLLQVTFTDFETVLPWLEPNVPARAEEVSMDRRGRFIWQSTGLAVMGVRERVH